MSTSQKINEKVHSISKTIADLDIAKLFRMDLSELNFEEYQGIFSSVKSIATLLLTNDLSVIPDDILSNCHSQLSEIHREYQAILGFSLKSTANPNNQRNGVINNLKQRYNALCITIAPVAALLSFLDPDFSDKLTKTKSQYDQFLKTATEWTEVIKMHSSNAEMILQNMKLSAGKIGVSAHSTLFAEEAKNCSNASFRWLWATFGCAVVTLIAIALIGFYFCKNPQTFNTPQAIQINILILMFISIFYYATVWCGKNYRSNRHNYVVNKHRQNALNTFETFVDSASKDEATKNAVLLQTTQCIFSLAHSGFISQDAESSSPSQILEIVRNLPNKPTN
ncbi:MAG: hypothetical protein PHQ23_07460 [Candidatus Wallbacteria bacterium]|nr:hypothetical protein [Candidatus Wallbacteria bacterium]